MAARATPIQNGCSPWSARCSDQLTVTSVRRAVISPASASIADASTSQIAAAQAASRRTPSLEPVRYASSSSQPVQHSRRKRWSWVPRAIIECAMPIISATSVFGRGAIQRAPCASSMSPRTGPTLTVVDTGLARGQLGAPRHVPRESARVDLRVLEREAAERDDQLGVLRDLVPVRSRRVDRVGLSTDDVRQDDLHGRAAVAVDRGRVAAVEIEEAVQEPLGVMEAARAPPAVGAAVDRRVAVLGLDARELARRQIECLVPLDLDERVAATCGAAAALEPASPHRRALDAAGVARASAIPAPIGDGSGSSATGCSATTAPSRTSTS